MVAAALVVVGAYLLGTFPSAALVGRRSGFDPAEAGSGNPGASNSFRLGGTRAGIAVLAADIGKGAIAAGVGLWVGSRGVAVAAGAAAVVGHVAPITRRFRGGKGVATAIGMMAVVEPMAAIVGVLAWAIVAAGSRKAVIASIVMMVVMVVALAVRRRPGWEVAAFAGLAVLILVRHRGNLDRLRRGEERSLGTREAS